MIESFKTNSKEHAGAHSKHSEINFEIRPDMLPKLGEHEQKISGYLSTEVGGVLFDIHAQNDLHILEVNRNTAQTAKIELTDTQMQIVKPFTERHDISEVRIARQDGKKDEDEDAWVMKIKVGPIGEPTEQTKITLTQEQKRALFAISDCVEKRRYYVPITLESEESVIIEVDEYPNGTWMAEVPAGAVDELKKSMPEWLGEEIDEAAGKRRAWENITPAKI